MNDRQGGITLGAADTAHRNPQESLDDSAEEGPLHFPFFELR
jgi:hypothetical protein